MDDKYSQKSVKDADDIQLETARPDVASLTANNFLTINQEHADSSRTAFLNE